MNMYPILPFQDKTTLLHPSPPAAKKTSFKKHVYLLILVFSIARLVLASIIELGNDEAYYWLYTQHLQWNYFDHPPMVALWGRLFTANLALEDYEVFVRLGSIVSCAAATWFLFKAVSVLHSEKAGWYAAILYNTSFYASIVAGIFIMPDSPQMLFWTLSIWMLARITVDDRNWLNWIVFGLSAGLCIMSKVHGVFLWIGLGLYILFQKRTWLMRPQLYIALLITAIVASPILVWNMQNHFITYRFHSQRVTINGRGIDYKSFFDECLGQIFFNNPVNVALTALSLTTGRKRLKKIWPHISFLLFTGLSLAFILLFLSLFRPTFPHWSGPAYVSLLPLAAIYLAEAKKEIVYPKWLRWSIGAFGVFLISWPLITHFYPGTWGSKNSYYLGSGDVTLDRYGWQEAGKIFDNFYKQQVDSKSIAPNTPVVCNTWWGAHVEYYFCRPEQLTMIGLGSMKEIHHYAWTNELRKEKVNFSNAFCIVPSDEYYDVKKHYAPYYNHITLVKIIEVIRNKRKAHDFYVYRLSGWKNTLPLPE